MKKGNYSNVDKDIMAITKTSINKSRLTELINFIKNYNYKLVGIANCLSMQQYADKLCEILEENGINVVSVNCKDSGLKYNELFENENSFPTCDPVGQAEYLNSKNTDLNIIVGLCLGHGILFNKYSKAPTTTFLVKDFSTGHCTIKNLE